VDAMSGDALHEAARESQLEAAPAVAVVIGLQVLLALVSRGQDWKLWDLSWWLWLVPVVPEVVLLGALTWRRPRRRLEQMGIRREAELVLLGILTGANALLVLAVIASLVSGNEKSGAQLLLKSVTVWASNVVTFGLWYWIIDGGGPVSRLQSTAAPNDFQFPQMENPDLAPKDWRPHLIDYVYVSYTNALAFSPTDAMPLTYRAKLLMLSESAMSALTILLVTARAVNIFT
jgi:hypothetical protein